MPRNRNFPCNCQEAEESKAINPMEDLAVILSASGMAEAGRILHHLKNNVLIVSRQTPHASGRRPAERVKHNKICGEAYTRRAQVATINGFSPSARQ